MYIFRDKVQEHYNIKNISFINRACVYMATVAPTSGRKVVAYIRWQRPLILIPSETARTTPKATRGLTETFLDCDETASITHRQWTHVGCERWSHCVCWSFDYTSDAFAILSYKNKGGNCKKIALPLPSLMIVSPGTDWLGSTPKFLDCLYASNTVWVAWHKIYMFLHFQHFAFNPAFDISATSDETGTESAAVMQY